MWPFSSDGMEQKKDLNQPLISATPREDIKRLDIQATTVGAVSNDQGTNGELTPHDCETRVIHIQKFRDNYYKWYKTASMGYGKLLDFVIFVLLFLTLVSLQHVTGALNDSENAWIIAITRDKPDLKCKDPKSTWAFIETALFKLIYAEEVVYKRHEEEPGSEKSMLDLMEEHTSLFSGDDEDIIMGDSEDNEDVITQEDVAGKDTDGKRELKATTGSLRISFKLML